MLTRNGADKQERNVLGHIRPLYSPYTLDYVNCLENPIGLAVEGIRPQYGALFYIGLKLFRAYNHHLKAEGEPLQFYMGQALAACGLQLNFLNGIEDLVSAVKAEIDRRNPVFVFGNLKELYYSNHYKTSDWMHNFLIKGYDVHKKLFMVIDGCQKKNEEHNYEEFVIPFEIMDQLNASFIETYGYPCVFSIIKSDNPPPERIEILLDYIDFMSMQLATQPYKELEMMKNGIGGEAPSINSLSLPLFEIIKNKDVLYSEIIRVMLESCVAEATVKELNEHKAAMLAQGYLLINNYVVSQTRGKHFDIEDKAESFIQADGALRESLMRIISDLREELRRYDKQKETLLAFENNADQIISQANEKVIFNFKGDKLYNCWITDESPKAVHQQTEKLAKDFCFSADIECSSLSSEVFFHAGLIFRTAPGDLYFWGIMNNESVVLGKTGEFQELFISELNAQPLTLSIRTEKNGYLFELHSAQSHKSVEFKASEIGQIVQIGVGCKTWNQPKPLTIEFNHCGFVTYSSI